MNEQTKAAVKGWLQSYGGDVEACARFMRDSLKVGGLKVCRALIQEAVA